MGFLLKVVACVALIWLAFFQTDYSNAQFLHGMLDGMADAVESHPDQFPTTQAVEAYRDRVVSLARETRGDIPESRKIGRLVGSDLNELPFSLDQSARQKVAEILRNAGGKL